MSRRPPGLFAGGGLLVVCCLSACAASNDQRYQTSATPDTVDIVQVLPQLTTVDTAAANNAAAPAAVPNAELVSVAQLAPVLPVLVGTNGPALAPPPPVAPVLRHATFAFTGDTLVHSPLVNRAASNALHGGFDFSPMFARVAPLLSAVHLGVCHLETPVAPPGEALSTYPLYGIPSEIAAGLRSAGYDRCSTASNHVVDRGVGGVDATVDALEAAGISQTGMARTPEEAVVRIIDVNGIAVAHLSYTFGLNGLRLPNDEPWRSNLIDSGRIVAAAADARARGADIVIASLHWGTEGRSGVDSYQLSVANEITASGQIDFVVGHHAHVIQPIVAVNDTWVAFGLGNFLSNMPTGDQWPASTQDGVIVEFTVNEQPDGTFAVQRPVAVPTWVDRNNGWIIRPVATDLVDPTVSDGVRAQLAASLERTRSVVGEFFAP